MYLLLNEPIRRQDFLQSYNKHVYCPGVGAYEPFVPILIFRIINILSYYMYPFPSRFSPQMTFEQFSLIQMHWQSMLTLL